MGNWKKGLLYTLTAGGFIVFWIYDFFYIVLTPNYIEKFKQLKEYREIQLENLKLEAATKEIIDGNRANKEVCCPKCGSTQLTANKKGFSLGKALVGSAMGKK